MSTFNILKNIRENEARQMARRVSASNFAGAPLRKATMKRWPSPSKIGRQQISTYQRAQNELQREQIEGAYRATQQRLAEAKQAVKDRSAMEAAQQNQADASEGERSGAGGCRL